MDHGAWSEWWDHLSRPSLHQLPSTYFYMKVFYFQLIQVFIFKEFCLHFHEQGLVSVVCPFFNRHNCKQISVRSLKIAFVNKQRNIIKAFRFVLVVKNLTLQALVYIHFSKDFEILNKIYFLLYVLFIIYFVLICIVK